MDYWQVNTVHNFNWIDAAQSENCKIERLQETRSFHVHAKDASDAIAQVCRYGGGTVIQVESITSVQRV